MNGSRKLQRHCISNRHPLTPARRSRSYFLARRATMPDRDLDYPITGWGIRGISDELGAFV
jgi:hypothetical protein